MPSPSDRGDPAAPAPSLSALPAFRHAALAQRLEMQRAVRFAAEAALRRGAPKSRPAASAVPTKASGKKAPVIRR